MKTIIRITAFFLSLSVTLSLFAACSQTPSVEDESEPVSTELEELSIEHETEFGGAYICISIDDFNGLGFSYGDEVRISFSNGYSLTVPYYNGYYTSPGEPLLVAYPGYKYIKACVNFGDDLWKTAKLSDNDTAVITVTEASKYLDMQDARNLSYSDERTEYESDTVFANFRSVNVGALKKDILFRSASPCDNSHNRAYYVDRLSDEAGIRFILNLSDNDEKISGYMSDDNFDCPYFAELYADGNVKPIALTANYYSDEYRSKVADGLIAMSEHEGPYLVHCTEGKDRTGFVIILLNAFCGATYEEIEADYMLSFKNYYGITKADEPERYSAIVDSLLIPMLESIVTDGSDVTTVELTPYAESYMLAAGMSDEQIAALREKLVL